MRAAVRCDLTFFSYLLCVGPFGLLSIAAHFFRPNFVSVVFFVQSLFYPPIWHYPHQGDDDIQGHRY